MTAAIYRLWLAYGPRPPGIRRSRLLEVLRPKPGERLLEVGPVPTITRLPSPGAFSQLVICRWSPSRQPRGRTSLVVWPAGQVQVLASRSICFPGQNAGALIQSFEQVFPESGATAPIATAGEAALVLAAYALIFGAVAALLVRARDVA